MQSTRTLASGRSSVHNYVSALAGPSSGPATAAGPCCSDHARAFASSPVHGKAIPKATIRAAAKATASKVATQKLVPKKPAAKPVPKRPAAKPAAPKAAAPVQKPWIPHEELKAQRYEEQQMRTLQLQRERVDVLRHMAETFTAVANDDAPQLEAPSTFLRSFDADAEATYGASGREDALLEAERAAREAKAAKAPLVSSGDWLDRKAELLAEAAQRTECAPAVSSANVAPFPKGTLVFVDSNTHSGAAVVLETVLLRRLELRLLLISGEIIYESPSVVTHAFNAHRLPEALAANAGPHDSIRLCSIENHAARRAAIRLIRQVTRAEGDLRGAVETYMLGAWEHFRSAVDDERALVASEDVARWAVEQDAIALRQLEATPKTTARRPVAHDHRTVDDWARREEVLRFAVQKHLLARSDRYICESGRDPWNVTRWRVRSRQEVTEMAAVRTMIERQSPEVLSFVEKARVLIDHSRPALDAPPAEDTDKASLPSLRPADLTLPSFTESDLVILRHIQASFFVSDRQFSPFSQTVPWILKRTDRYGEVFDAECTARFLVEIGVRSPWDNWAALGSTLEFVKGERRAEGRAQKSDDKEATSLPSEPAPTASASHPSLTPVLGPDDLYPTDQLDHLRHDFGQLNVFVIDDPDAAELDDGVSVERCADENRVWVHVHIADPTTLLHPGHRLATSALAKASTAYLPEGNYPLLPDSLTLDRFSLGGKGGVVDPVRGQEALSFSALVDLGTGEIVDYRVRAGIIRNVHVTSYQAVNTALGCQPAEACWPIGRPPAQFEATKPRPFKPEWMTDITLLQQVAKAIHRRRFEAGAISWSSAEYQVKVSPSPLPTLPFQPTSRAVFSDGAPFVAYRVTPAGGSRSESQQLVASCMTLAGNVAGRFFRDRGLPTAYRHSPAAISKTREGLERLLASRDPESGHVDPLELDRLGVVLQAGKVSLRPETHWAMGITAAEGGYVRVTSPLRRYGDIIAHWQIKHALLAEASSASSGPASGARTPRSSALFSASEVLDWGTSVELTSRLVKEASDRSRAFWAVYALERHARKQSTLDAHGSSYPPVHAYPFTRAPMLPTARLGPFTTAIVVKSNVDPLSPLARTIVVAVPDLGLELEAHYPKGKTYALGDRVNVLVDEFYLGAQSRMVGTVIGGGEEA